MAWAIPAKCSPSDVYGLVLWLDANDASTLHQDSGCSVPIMADADVGCWQDKSGMNHHVIQSANNKPTYRLSQQNGMPALVFEDVQSGDDDALVTQTTGQITANGSYTKLVVFSYNSLTSKNNLISSAPSGTAFWGGSSANIGKLHAWNLNGPNNNPGFVSQPTQMNLGQYHIGTIRYDNTAANGLLSVLNVDGQLIDSDDSVQNHAASVISIGNQGVSNGLSGQIAEAIVYDRALSDAEIDCIEGYLGSKWGISTTNAAASCQFPDSIILNESHFPSYKVFQRDSNDQHDFLISGSYSGDCQAVEASFNSMPFTVIDSAPANNMFSGQLADQTVGQGDLMVRCQNNPNVSDTATAIGIGDVYVVAGQSNAEGRGINRQYYSTVAPTSTLQPTVYSQDNVWFVGNDRTDPGSPAGSVWPIVGGYIVENTDVPVAFITVATGGKALVSPPQWSKGGVVCNGQLNCYDDMVNQVVNSGVNAVKAILWFQGESDSNAGVSRTTYNAALDQFIADARSDLPGTPDLVSGVIGPWVPAPEAATGIRSAIIDAWQDNNHILNGPQAYDIHISDDGVGDSIHYVTDDEMQTLGYRWWKALEQHYYGGSSGRGPVVSHAHSTLGSSTIDVHFQTSSALLPASGLTTNAWKVSDDGILLSVLSATVTGVDTVRLTLGSSISSQNVLLSYADLNSGENEAVLTDSTTGNTALGPSPLPADPFSDLTVNLNPAPLLLDILRHQPMDSHTNAESVVFRLSFSETVEQVDVSDFDLSGSSASDGSVNQVTAVSGSVYDVMVTGLSSSNGVINLDIRAANDIQDTTGNGLLSLTPSGNEEAYTLDTLAPDPPQVVTPTRGAPVRGTGEPNTIVEVSAAGATCTAEVMSDGSWFCHLMPQPNHEEDITAIATDSVGNMSDPTTSVDAIDLVPPADPVVTIPANGAQVSGSGEPGAHVVVVTDSGASCEAEVGIDGSWSCVLDSSPNDGEDLTVTITDFAENSHSITVSDVFGTSPDVNVNINNCVTKLAEGQSVIYELTARNDGDIDVQSVSLNNDLSDFLTSISWTCEAYNGAVCPSATGSGAVTSNFDLPVDASISYLISAVVTGGLMDQVNTSASLIPPNHVNDVNLNGNFAEDSDLIVDLIFIDGFQCAAAGSLNE